MRRTTRERENRIRRVAGRNRALGMTVSGLVLLASTVALAVVQNGKVTSGGKPVANGTLTRQPQKAPDDPDKRGPVEVAGGFPVTFRADDEGNFTVPEGLLNEVVTVFEGDLFGSFSGGAWEGFRQVVLERQEPCVSCRGQCEKDTVLKTQPAALGIYQVKSALAPADMASQWAFKKLGLPLKLDLATLAPVTVAVVDTGVDYRNPHLDRDSFWRNTDPGADPEFPDDRFGWDFVAGDNRPWDDNGHGTFVAGLILAVNPAARIMPLKVMRSFGAGFSSDMSRAIIYAVDRGARVINVSLGAKGLSRIAQIAVDYARAHGALVVAAAGNDGVDTAEFGPAGLQGVLAVAALDANDKKPPFGNWGQEVALAAPGVDIVSLRARDTDFVLVATGGKDYTPGANITGADRWLFRATGTSFSAPFVSGAASLLFARDPNLTPGQVERMLVESAADVETPGWDQFTGAGRLDIARALQADPNYYLTARVAKIAPVEESGRRVVKVFGTAAGSRLERYEIQLGQGENPRRWKTVAAEKGRAVEDDLLGVIPIREITAGGAWSIRVQVFDTAKKVKEARGTLDVQ